MKTWDNNSSSGSDEIVKFLDAFSDPKSKISAKKEEEK